MNVWNFCKEIYKNNKIGAISLEQRYYGCDRERCAEPHVESGVKNGLSRQAGRMWKLTMR